MRLVSLTAAIMLVASGTAATVAQTAAGYSGYVGNTLDVRYEKGGARLKIVMAADGTFKLMNPKGERENGDWLSDGRYICWINKAQVHKPGENIRCERMESGKKVGDTWKHADAYGEATVLTLQAGDQIAGK